MDFRRWDKNMGGIDACLDFDDPDNKGLRACLHKINIQKFYQKWCHKVSLADYLTMASEAAITDLSTSIWEMGRTTTGIETGIFTDKSKWSAAKRAKLETNPAAKTFPAHTNPMGGKFA
jgi:hypothetical protein